MKNSAFFSQRSLLTFMALTGLVNAYLMRLCLNITILKMINENEISKSIMLFQHTASTMMDGSKLVTTLSASDKKFYWSEEEKGIILSAFFIGYALLHIPGSFLGQKYGGKTILNIGLFLTALCTLLTPITVYYGGASGLITLRFLMGIGEAPAYPALIYLLSCWIPEKERGRVSSIVFCGGQIGSIICNLLTGFVLEYTEGYAEIFYIFGIIGILWNIAFHFLVYNTPFTHPRISAEEKEYLRNEVGDLVATTSFFQIPWTSMLASPAVLVLIVAQMGHDWGFYILVTEMPNYLKTIMHFDYQKLGIFTSIPFLVSYLFSLFCGAVSDHIVSRKLVTLTGARQIFTAIGAAASSIFILLIYYADRNEAATLICFTLSMGLMGGFYCGAQANFLDLCPNYSGALMGLVNGTGAICGFLVPYLTGKFTTNAVYDEWQPVFWISFSVLLVTLLTYLVWGSAEVQSWNDNPDEDNWIKQAYRGCCNRKDKGADSENKLNLNEADNDNKLKSKSNEVDNDNKLKSNETVNTVNTE